MPVETTILFSLLMEKATISSLKLVSLRISPNRPILFRDLPFEIKIKSKFGVVHNALLPSTAKYSHFICPHKSYQTKLFDVNASIEFVFPETYTCLPLFKGMLSNNSLLAKMLIEELVKAATTSPFGSQEIFRIKSSTDWRANNFTGFQESSLIDVLLNISRVSALG